MPEAGGADQALPAVPEAARSVERVNRGRSPGRCRRGRRRPQRRAIWLSLAGMFGSQSGTNKSHISRAFHVPQRVAIPVTRFVELLRRALSSAGHTAAEESPSGSSAPAAATSLLDHYHSSCLLNAPAPLATPSPSSRVLARPGALPRRNPRRRRLLPSVFCALPHPTSRSHHPNQQ